MKKLRSRILLLLLCLAVLISAETIRVYASSLVVLDVTKNVVYQNIMADTIIARFDDSVSTAKDRYNGGNYAILGKVSGLGKNGRTFRIKAMDGGGSTIECTVNSILSDRPSLKVGDVVQVYGRVKINSWLENSIEVSVRSYSVTTATTTSENLFSMINGSCIDRNTMLYRKMAQDCFTYRIPESWAGVEYALPEDSGVKGYQYKLNELTGDGLAESVFLFYVDKRLLEDAGDISKPTRVQKAIIRNILGNESILHRYVPLLDRDIDMITLTTDYASFASYSGNYQDPNGVNYRVEFMFLPSDNKGMRCLLYVYQRENHVDDVLLMMRNMDI